MLPYNYDRIKEYITYLENCLQKPDEIDTTLLKKNIRELKQMYRNARGKDQQGYIMTSIEGVDMLERDSGKANCKVVTGANLYNLKAHLAYLKIKHRAPSSP
jgi:hypothetical protein